MFSLVDKRVAGSRVMRVLNAVLQGMAPPGGSSAALAAQWFLPCMIWRRGFQITYWAIVAAQVALTLLVD